KAIARWFSDSLGNGHDIKGRIIDMSDKYLGRALGNETLINTNNNNDQTSPSAVIYNGKALVTWSSLDNDVDEDIKAQVINMGYLEQNINYFKAPLLERDYEVKARIVEELQ
ncbi:MAG: hypothetical protein MI892_31430, partial [Desulfobacterales bacterium]|nr:hypothetical protein [Desulfobacterales bacterium]